MGFTGQLILSATAEELSDKFYKDIPYHTFLTLLNMDPTFDDDKQPRMMGTYGKQLLTWYRATPDAQPYGFKELLTRYHEAIKWLPTEYKSVNKFKTFKAFLEFVQNVLPGLMEEVKDERAAEGAKVVFEDERWKVINPKTYFASVYYAGDAQWCTADSSSSNYFNQYSANGVLLMCMFKSESTDSVQVFIPRDSKVLYPYEARDYEDDWVDVYEALGQSVLKFITSKFGPDALASLHDAYMENSSDDDDYDEEEEEEEEEESGPFFGRLENGFTIESQGAREPFRFIPLTNHNLEYYLTYEEWEEIDRCPFHALFCAESIPSYLVGALHYGDWNGDTRLFLMGPAYIWKNPIAPGTFENPADPERPLAQLPILEEWVTNEHEGTAGCKAITLSTGTVVAMVTRPTSTNPAVRLKEGVVKYLIEDAIPNNFIAQRNDDFIDRVLGFEAGTTYLLVRNVAAKDPFLAVTEALKATVTLRHSMDRALVYTAHAVVTFEVGDQVFTTKMGSRRLSLSWLSDTAVDIDAGSRRISGYLVRSSHGEAEATGYLDELLVKENIKGMAEGAEPGNILAFDLTGWILPLAAPVLTTEGWAKSENDTLVWFTKPA